MMTQPPLPSSVRLVISLRSADPPLIGELTGRLALEFGPILLESERWTEKASRAPAGELVRQWIAPSDSIKPENLVKIKLHVLRVEQLYLNPQGKRRIVLDAGYLDPARVVRASETDAPHRVYLGAGIHGEVLLRWQDPDGYVPFPWTPESDTVPPLLDFFARTRTELLRQSQRDSESPSPHAPWKQ